MTLTLLTPPRIVFGCGEFGGLGREAAALGRRALVVTGRSAMRESGTLDRAVGLLRDAGLGAAVFDKVEHDPTLGVVDNGVRAARQSGRDLVVGLGGGSPLDAAKAIAILLNKPGAAADYFSGAREIEGPGAPFLAAPTTSGTGAEITKNSVLTDADARVKKSLRSPHMVARVAIVDPELTLSCPAALTAHSGMDALTQAIECYVSRAAHPVSDALALTAARALFHHLLPAVKDGGSPEHREAMAFGSMTCGLAFANASLGAVHGLAHPMGALLGLPHGLICAALLAPVIEFNYPACAEKMDVLARDLGLDSGCDLPAAVRRLADEVGVPSSLAERGLTESRIADIVADCRSGSMSNNPREATDEDLAAILRKLTQQPDSPLTM